MTLKIATRTAATIDVTAMTGRAVRAPRARSAAARGSKRRMPTSRQVRAPLPMTVSRTTPTKMAAVRIAPTNWISGPSGLAPTLLASASSPEPMIAPTKNVTATTVPKASHGEGPAYASARARRSMAWLPLPAISPSDRRPGPSNRKNRRDPLTAPMMTKASPRIDASQPTTKRPGAARPSMVRIAAPGRGGGTGPCGCVSSVVVSSSMVTEELPSTLRQDVLGRPRAR